MSTTVKFTVPLPSQHGGTNRQYKRFLSDEAWKAAMAGPAEERVLWPANGARGTEVNVVVTLYRDGMCSMSKAKARAKSDAELIVHGVGMSLWNMKYPPKLKFYVRKPRGKKGLRAEVRVIQS